MTRKGVCLRPFFGLKTGVHFTVFLRWRRYEKRRVYGGLYRKSNSQGFIPVCFLKAVEKWEMEE